MAKQKYEDFRQIAICGILDINDNGERVIVVDEEEHNLDDIIQELMGNMIEIKAQI